jgi:tetratricopeptide (TPR) repeat protein
MTRASRGPTRSGYIRLSAVSVALVFALASCGTSSNTTDRPNAKKASTELNAGLKAHAAGNLSVAVADYQGALKYDHKNKYALYNLGVIDAANGNYGLAEDKYRVVLALDPNYAPALYNLAILRTARGDSTEAMTLYERVLAADTKAAAAWLNLGLLQRAAGQHVAGDSSIQKAITLNPKLKDPPKSTVTPATPSGTATK